MDRLPTKQQLLFQRKRKELHSQLAVVIRGLATKAENQWNAERIREYADRLQPSSVSDGGCLPYISPKGRLGIQSNKMYCLFSEISFVVLLFWKFILGKSGYKWYIRTIEKGIMRLEWLRDNWEHLTITGNLRDGYELVLESKKS